MNRLELSQLGTHKSDQRAVGIKCQKLSLTSPIETLSGKVTSSRKGDFLTSLRIAKDGKQRTYGDITVSSSNVLFWDFLDEFPLIGLYGWQSLVDGVAMINSIGFYVLDEACVANNPSVSDGGNQYSILPPDF